MSSSEPSYEEKETLGTDDGHDPVLPLNNGHTSETSKDEEEGRRNSTAPQKASLGLNYGHGQAGATTNVDVEKAGQDQTTVRDESNDPNVVSWDGKDDPADPLNWSNAIKVVNVGLVSGICLVTPLASCKYHHSSCYLWGY